MAMHAVKGKPFAVFTDPHLGSANVVTPSPPKLVPSSENSAVFCEMGKSCPFSGSHPVGQKLNANSATWPTKGVACASAERGRAHIRSAISAADGRSRFIGSHPYFQSPQAKTYSRGTAIASSPRRGWHLKTGVGAIRSRVHRWSAGPK